MKEKLLIVLLLILSGSLSLWGESGKPEGKLPSPFEIIPQPQKVEMLKGLGLEAGQLKYLVLTGDIKRPVMGEILSRLTEKKNKGTGGKDLVLKTDTSGVAPVSEEGYVLTVSKDRAEIISRGEAGLFYGCQTLEQLLEDARDFNVSVPACRITDYPALGYRAIHFDVKHHLNQMDYYYRNMDRLARYKINAVIFEFEDKLRYQRQPLVGAPQAISIGEMAALTRYARERHIEITPLVQGLGHATFILKHQTYAHLRELPWNRWAFCPLHEGTYQVLFDLYRDAMDATPGSRYLHVGGDEIGNIGLCPRCKPTADREGTMSLNLYWLKRVCEFAEENGRIPIFWDDTLLKEAGVFETTYKDNYTEAEANRLWYTGEERMKEVLSEFPQNCIYMRWNYNIALQPGNIRAMDWYKKNGLKVMIATASNSGPAALFPFDERDNGMESRGMMAVRSFIGLAEDKGAEGMLCTAWDDVSPHFETYWRGFIASAEYSWSPSGRTLEEFDRAWMQREFSTFIPDYTAFYKKLRDAAAFWEKAFNENGNRTDIENILQNFPNLAHWMPPKEPGAPEKTDFSDLLIDLPDPQNPGKWSEKYAAKLAEAAQIMESYGYTSRILDDLYRNSKKNRYHWELFSALNDFQLTAPELMLALRECDTDDDVKRKKGIEKISLAMNDFDRTWQNLQNVYSKTRFVANPENYVPDRYFHFASQREDLTWMIQIEELYHKMIIQWLQKITP